MKRGPPMQHAFRVRQSLGQRLHPTPSSVPTTPPGPRASQKSGTPVCLPEHAPAFQVSAPLRSGRSLMPTTAAPLGPLRPRSALFGILRPPLGSPPLSYYLHALLTWGVGGSALRALSPRCGRREPIAKRSGWAPQSRVSRPLFVSGARRTPLGSQGLRAPPPCSRGASPGKGRGGVKGRSLRGGARKQAELDQGA